jgi:LL-diaminopimelate aminotransferase
MAINPQQSFIRPAERIAGFKPYFFASLNQKLNRLRSNGVDIIRLDMGSPDLPPEPFIVDRLVESARQPGSHGYAQIGGAANFKKAVAEYYRQRHEVDLDPNREVLALLGSKEGLFNLSQVILNPGDIVLVPDPGYPVYSASGQIAGAEVFTLPLTRENGYLPDFTKIPAEILSRARLLWLNYPNNPTGAVAPLSFFAQAVEFSQKNQIVIANDAPYMDVCFDGYRAPSILEVDGAREVAVEFNSLSKTYNMAGWRLGMAVGNEKIIGFLHTYKSQTDSSHFTAVMDAGAAALLGDQTWIGKRNDIYRQRRNIVVSELKRAGFDVTPPPAAIYVWAHLPQRFTDSSAYCDRLLDDTGVSVTPGIVYGQFGEGFIRISLGTPTERIAEAMTRLSDWTLQGAQG